MKKVLRKTAILLGNVTYQSGDFSNNLQASDIAVEVVGERVILSLDLSPISPGVVKPHIPTWMQKA